MDAGPRDESHGVLDTDGPVHDVVGRPSRTGIGWDLLSAAQPPVACWASPDGTLIVGAGSVENVEESGPHPLARQHRRVTELFSRIDYDGPDPAGPRLLGGMRFMNDDQQERRWEAFPDSWFFLPEWQAIECSGNAWVTTASDREPPLAPSTPVEDLPKRIDETPVPERRRWLEQVDAARDEIRNDRYEKVVLAHALDLELASPVSLVSLVKHLRETNPGCFVTAFQPEEETFFVTATPERLVTREGPTVHTDALAGSTGRGGSTVADEQLSKALERSEKNRLEHNFVVDAITDRLESLGGSVTVGERRVRQLRSVQHLHTPIEGRYPTSPHVLQVVDALHPTPAVGGLPRRAALDAIRRIEVTDRGWYAAPLGWIDANGDGTFAIGIRSGLVRNRSARLFAGDGIVADSDPADEWEELQLKYQPLRDSFESG